MRTKRRVTYEAIDVDVICDKCGKPGGISEDAADAYRVAEVVISMRVGTSYPEGGFAEITEFDCCAKCFTEHVMPAMAAAGFAAVVREIDT